MKMLNDIACNFNLVLIESNSNFIEIGGKGI
jgi:hypothetical protein